MYVVFIELPPHDLVLCPSPLFVRRLFKYWITSSVLFYLKLVTVHHVLISAVVTHLMFL